MRTRILVGTVVIVLGLSAAGCAVWRHIRSADEEAPIIVKNGSMDAVAGDNPSKNHHWKWNRRGGGGNPVFIHDPVGPYGNDDPSKLFVHIIGHPDNTCDAQPEGAAVTVTFSDGFSLKLSRLRVGSSGKYRTHVEASTPDGLDEVQGAGHPTLRHGTAGEGYISSVTANGSPCTFPNRQAVTCICVSPDEPEENCADSDACLNPTRTAGKEQ